MFGKMLNEKLGSWNFWLMVIGMNLTFGPMHILGLQGQPRRMYVWTEARAGEGFFNLAFWNLVASIGSFILAVGVLIFLINVVITTRKGKQAPLDPWNARTLEWLTTSPPKEHNFDRIPVVHHLDEFFHRKYEEDHATGEMKEIATGEQLVRAEEDHAESHIHLPSPSYWPLILALGVGTLGMGVVYGVPIMVIGAAIILFASFGMGHRALGCGRHRLRPTVTRWWRHEGAGSPWLIQQFTPITATTPGTTRRSESPTTSWRCGCSSGPNASSSED